MKGPKKPILSKAQEPVAPAPPTGVASPSPNSGQPLTAAAGDSPPSSGHTSTGETDERVAVLSLSMVGEIMAARQACRALFGRDANLLVGQNIRVLLKGGLDNEVGHFLLKYQTGESAGGTSMLNVIALRKDGTEFPARVTTQTWSWDKNVAKKGDTSARNWTAIFRDLSEAPASATPPEASTSQEGQPVETPAAISLAPLKTSEEPPLDSPEDPDAAENSPDDSRNLPRPAEVVAKAPLPKVAPPRPVVPVPAPAPPKPVVPIPAPAPPKDLEGVAVELSRRFEEQLAGLRQEREDLKSKLAAEQSTVAEFKQRLQGLENHPPGVPGGPHQARAGAEASGRSDFELRAQLDAAREAAGFAQAALQEEIARREKLEEQLKKAGAAPSPQRVPPGQGQTPELNSLRHERDELKPKLKAQEDSVSKASSRTTELEGLFNEGTTELQRVKSELVGLTVARDRAQAEWRQQLADAQAVNSSLEKSLGEALARHNSQEGDLSKLRLEYAELTSKLAAEQLAAAQSEHMAGEAKGRPGRNVSDSKRVHAELEKLNAERKRADSQWREQLDAANNLKSRIEASLFEALERLKNREQEVAKLRQERDELRAKLAAEQQAAAQLKQRVEQFEAQLRNSSGAEQELAKLRQEREDLQARLAAEQQAVAQLKQQIDQLAAQSGKNTGAEEEVARLRQERDRIQGRLTTEQQAATQLKLRVDHFEAQSRKLVSDLGQAKADAAKRERTQLELQTQLDAAREAAGSNDAALKEEVARRQTLEEQLQNLDGRLQQEQTEQKGLLDAELSSLRQERDELKGKLEAQQKAVTEATQRVEELAARISQDATESARARSELEVHNAERDRIKEDMQIELAGAHAARTRLESSLGEALERGNRFEAEATQLRRDLEALNSKLAGEQKSAAELKRRAEQAEKEMTGAGQAVLKKEIARREQLEQRLKTLTSGLKEEQAERKKRFDKELSSLRTERDALDSKLASEQKQAADAARSAQELERRLNQNAADVERAKTELEQLAAERERSESAWREQLDTAFIAKKELAGAWAGAVEQNKRLEEELAKLRQEQEELNHKLEAEQQVAADSKHRASDVEGLLNRNATESERIRAELEKQNAEMDRKEAEWREQLESVEAVKATLEASLEEAQERSKNFEAEVSGLREEREGLQDKLEAELQAAAESRRRASEAESQLNEAAEELHRVKAELQQQQAKFEQSDSNWRKQLESAQTKKLESSRAAGGELAALRRERDELQAKLTAELQAAAESRRWSEEAESQLTQSAAELDRVNAELQEERAKLEQAESRWRKQLEAAQAKKTDSKKASSNEAAALRRERDDLQDKLTTEARAVAESKRRATDAEGRLSQRTEELERVKAELQQQRAKIEQSESNWRKQLETAQSGRIESGRSSGKEAATLRQERDNLQARLAAEHQTAAESARQAEEAEIRLNESETELERLNAELKKQSANVELLESKWRRQSEAAQAQKIESQKILAAADDCNRRLEKELAELRLKYDKLAGRSKAEAPPVPRPVERPAPAESRPAPVHRPTCSERVQPQAQGDSWQYPAQVQLYEFEFAKSPPPRRTRETREPARRRRQP